MAKPSNKNNSAGDHEVLPPMVLKGHFIYHLSEQYKKKLNLWSKVINVTKRATLYTTSAKRMLSLVEC